MKVGDKIRLLKDYQPPGEGRPRAGEVLEIVLVETENVEIDAKTGDGEVWTLDRTDGDDWELLVKDDPVDHPNHYQVMPGLEAVDLIAHRVRGKEGPVAYHEGNVLKYMLRWEKKNGVEDLRKAARYLEWLIQEVDQ